MSSQELLVAIAVVPTAVATVAAFVARPLGERRPRTRDAVLALGVAVGFALGLAWLGVRPDFPLASHESAWTWVVWIAAAGALLGAALPPTRPAGASVVLLRWAFATLAVWLVLRPLVPHVYSGLDAALRAAAWGAGATLLGTALSVNAVRGGGVVSLLPLLFAFLATGLVLLEGGLSPMMADAAIALGAATMATVFLVRVRGGPALPAAASHAVAPTLTAFLAAGHAYLNSGTVVRLPLHGTLLVLAAASAVLVPRPRWAVAVSLVFSVAAALLVLRFDEPFLMIDGL
jgi:hypothetical protein